MLLGMAFIVAVAAMSVIALTLGTAAAEAKTVTEQCGKYTKDSELLACRDGWKGADCSDYLITHDQSHVDICQTAARAAADAGATGETDKDSDETDGGTSTTSEQDNTDSLNSISSLLTQMQQSQNSDTGTTTCTTANGKTTCTTTCTTTNNSNPLDISVLTGNGTSTTNRACTTQNADNTYGQYINGAGNKQAIRVTKAKNVKKDTPTPAIIFINGGGWHYDDKVGDKVAPLASERGYTTFVATYRLGSSGIYYQYEDVLRAIMHVRNNANMYNIDPSKIAIWGDSAGASLAIRAASSGRSGVAGAVGWSAPTNAYTAIFKSAKSFAIGMDHSTCVPTDAAGALNALNALSGGSGDSVAYNGDPLLNNGVDVKTGQLNTSNPLSTLTTVLTYAQRIQQSGAVDSATSTAANAADGNTSDGMSQLTSKKMIECLDNFNSASPALFASPLTPPTFLAGYKRDPLVDPGQLYQMRDKLRGMGVASSVLLLPGVQSNDTVDGENHLDYNKAFVSPSLDFLDKYVKKEAEKKPAPKKDS